MKILQIGMSYNPGGVESFVMSYYRQLVKKSVQFDFICMYQSLAYEKEIQSLGGRIFYVTDIKKNPIVFKKELGRILEEGQYDAVHVNMLSAANIVPLKVAKKAGVKKIIAHSHNSSSPGFLRNVLHRWNRGKIGNYATDYFACSRLAGEWLFTEKIRRSEQYSVIHNAVDVDKFLYDVKICDLVKKELDVENRFVIGHIGRFEEQKNHIFLINIFEAIAKRREDAVLLLVGTGELEEQIREAVEKKGLKSQVKFLGMRSDVPRIWQAVDVFLLPSLFEGLPIVMVEAQAAGVPCVLSDTITTEVCITENVEFVALNQSADFWADCVLKWEAEKKHQNNQKIYRAFQESGYEINSASERLMRYYKR